MPVEPGTYAEDYVEVTGDGLREGMRVVIGAMTVLALDEVRKAYPGGVEALRGVSLRVERGELLAVVGPSGSGKSTLLHIMGTLERPTSGELAVAGHDVAGLGDRALAGLRARHIGFVFQQFFLLDGMSALENVATGLLYTGAARGRAARSGRATCSSASASATGSATIRRSCRAASASAWRSPARWSARPSIVFADEPTGNLDSRVRRRDRRAAARAQRARARRSS